MIHNYTSILLSFSKLKPFILSSPDARTSDLFARLQQKSDAEADAVVELLNGRTGLPLQNSRALPLHEALKGIAAEPEQPAPVSSAPVSTTPVEAVPAKPTVVEPQVYTLIDDEDGSGGDTPSDWVEKAFEEEVEFFDWVMGGFLSDDVVRAIFFLSSSPSEHSEIHLMAVSTPKNYLSQRFTFIVPHPINRPYSLPNTLLPERARPDRGVCVRRRRGRRQETTLRRQKVYGSDWRTEAPARLGAAGSGCGPSVCRISGVYSAPHSWTA